MEIPIEKLGVVLTYACSMHKICDYCYAKSFANLYKEMDMAYFSRLLSWIKSIGKSCQELKILGGEPTEYSQFSKAMELLNEASINLSPKIVLYTHGCFDKKKLDILLQNEGIKQIAFHYDEGYLSHKNIFRRNFYRNIKELSRFGREVFLRYNTNDLTSQHGELFNLAANINAPIIYSLSTPCVGCKSYTKIEDYADIIPHLRLFIDQATRNGIKVKLSRPIPLCALSDENSKDELIKLGGFRFECSPSPTVNPDGSILTCSVLFKWKSLRTKNAREFKSAIHDAIKRGDALKYKQMIPQKCKSCQYFISKICQGGCLAYREAESQ